MPNPWFRFYGGEFLNDEKIAVLDGNERSIWLTLLCFAAQKDGVIRFMTERRIIELSGIKNWKRYEGTFKKFQNYGMVELSNGNVTVLNWAKRQYSEGYLRVKTFRETQKKQKSNGNVTPYTDTESDTDTENTNTAFEKFWSIFPKKVAKRKAEIAWKKIPAAEHEAIYADVNNRRATEDWMKQNGQFIPYPASYLNAERWKDKLDTLKAAPPPKKCKECRTTTSSSYIQTTGGYLCGECDVGLRERSGSLREMTAGAVKTMPK